MIRGSSIAAAVGLAMLASAGAASAQGAGQAAAADALFREGKKLLEKKRFAEACPMLAESYRIDPATGTLLATALCYEGEGKTLSAWKAYNEAAVRANHERSAEREQAALARARELEPRLSRLKIAVDPAAAGLEVTLDGAPVSREALRAPIPVDLGEHAVEARAPGKQPFTTRVRVGAVGGTQTVSVGPLADAAGAPPPPAPEPPAPSFFTPLRVAGLVIGGVGLAGLGLGGGFTAQALAKKSESTGDCTGNACGPAGFAARNAARTDGNVATAGFVGGGVLLGVGITLFVLGRPSSQAATAAAPGLALVPVASPSWSGLLWRGSFQ